jgi:hypothetical protein
MIEQEIHEDDLAPGADCPREGCDMTVVTWWSQPVPDVVSFGRDFDEDNACWIHAEKIEPAPLRENFAGNVIIIDHEGPTLDE